MRMNIVRAIVVTPPLDMRAKNAGFNVLYRLVDLGVPFVYSLLHASAKMLRERPEVVRTNDQGPTMFMLKRLSIGA